LLICTEERQPDLIHHVPYDYRLPVHGGDREHLERGARMFAEMG